MLDLLGIIFSSVIMLMVIVRAVRMDAMLPWFQPPKTGADSSGLRLQPGGTDGNNAGAATRLEARRGA